MAWRKYLWKVQPTIKGKAEVSISVCYISQFLQILTHIDTPFTMDRHLLPVCRITVISWPALSRILWLAMPISRVTMWIVGLAGIVTDCRWSSRLISYWTSRDLRMWRRWVSRRTTRSAERLSCDMRMNGRQLLLVWDVGLISKTTTRHCTRGTWSPFGGFLSSFSTRDWSTRAWRLCPTQPLVQHPYRTSKLTRTTRKSLIRALSLRSKQSLYLTLSSWCGPPRPGRCHRTSLAVWTRKWRM